MSTVPASAELPRARLDRADTSGWLAKATAPATAVVLLGVALMALFTPLWIHFALTATGGAASVGSVGVAIQLSDTTISELLVGPATFDFAGPAGRPFYTADEAAHLRDVRLVLFAFLGVALASLLVVIWSVFRRGREPQTWRALARGGAALVATLLALGVFAGLAFGVAFELFHRMLFPGGNWAFPADSNLVRLYPLAFWQLSAAALGALGVGLGAATWLVATRRARALEASA